MLLPRSAAFQIGRLIIGHAGLKRLNVLERDCGNEFCLTAEMQVHRHEVDHRLDGGHAREQHGQESSPVVIGGGGTKPQFDDDF